MLSHHALNGESARPPREQMFDLRSHYRAVPPERLELISQRLQRTWNSLRLFWQPGATHFPADRLCITDSEIITYPRTKPTNIGLAILSQLAAEKVDLLTIPEAEKHIRQLLDSLAHIERCNGFFYDWYDTQTGEKLTKWPEGGNELQPFLSSVDNAWLALALLITQKIKPSMAEFIQEEFLSQMNFESFFDPDSQELWGGYEVAKQAHSQFHYSRERVSEPRIIHWVNAALCQDEGQRQIILKRLLDKQGKVPKQLAGGAMFELLMPQLFIQEDYLEEAVQVIFQQHREYGEQHLDGCIGLSVADDPTQDNHYREMGVGGTYPPASVLSSHGVALALLVQPDLALLTLQKIEKLPGFYTEVGYFDAVDLKTGAVTDTQVFVNQAMVFLSFFTYLDDSLREAFAEYFSPKQIIFPLLKKELR